MAEIQIVYLDGYCEFDCADFCDECIEEYAGDLGCRMFSYAGIEDTLKDGQSVVCIPFGNCIHARFKRKYKGMSVKSYELEEVDDPYSPYAHCMILKTRNGFYYCEKVTLDGVCVYGEEVQNARNT